MAHRGADGTGEPDDSGHLVIVVVVVAVLRLERESILHHRYSMTQLKPGMKLLIPVEMR
jgi:hypothetical protein